MLTIGMIGGMSWESTIPYYQILNTVVKEKLGGLHSAKCILHSVDFAELEACMAAGDWETVGAILAAAASGLERAGAECLVICTNTMHKVAATVRNAVSVPLLHIADCTADELAARGVSRVGLLGTRTTMEENFYKERLLERRFDVLIPEAADREQLNTIIFAELCRGVVTEASKTFVLKLVGELAKQGADGVILGCTELGMLATQSDTEVALFDTTRIHALKAALYALENGE